MRESWQIAVDTGGTFTDCVATDPEGHTRIWKVLSDGSLRASLQAQVAANAWRIQADWPEDPTLLTGYQLTCSTTGEWATVTTWQPDTQVVTLDRAWVQASEGHHVRLSAGEPAPLLACRLATATPLSQPLPAISLRLGTTRATNALLERKGAATMLITNHGLEDLLRIGNQSRPELFALNVQKPAPLPAWIVGVKARLAADGEELAPLDRQEVSKLIAQAREKQVETVAIALLHSYLNPAHERAIAAAFRDAGFAHVSASADLAPEIRLLPRMQTAVADAYLSPVLRSYLDEIEQKLPPTADLKVMSSAGGLMQSRQYHAKDSLLSGPAGGVVGAARCGQRAGVPAVISFDMGGTSTDVARWQGRLDYQFQTQVGAANLLLPSLAVETVAAGGGSICRFDGEKLSVGPDSAGAFPGPACYGAGGPLTVTDVNLLLGYVDPLSFLIPLDRKAAEATASAMAEAANLTLEALLQGFREIADETMAAAIRRMALRKGFDPATYTLVSFGGAGGQHACAMADLLGMNQILIPREASVLSAWGIQQAPVKHLCSRQVLQAWSQVEQELPDWEQALIRQLEAEFAAEGWTASAPLVTTTMLELRLAGQNSVLEVLWSPEKEVLADFRQRYEATFGHWLSGREVELVAIRVEGSWEQQWKEATPKRERIAASARPVGSLQGRPVYHWESLLPGQRLVGPALISSPITNVWVADGWQASVDAHGGLVLKQVAASTSTLRGRAHATELELFSQRFQQVAEEMGEMLRRTSLSVNVKERLDFSCALLDPDGRLVANAPHVPVHLGSLGVCLRAVREVLPLRSEDVVVTNHPAYGGSHLPDVTLLMGVFDDEDELLGYVVNRAHHAEIGGSRPGSMPPMATTLAEEGVVIAPTYLVEKGVWRGEALEALLKTGPWPSRSPEENLADLRAALAAARAGAQALRQLAEAEGRSKVAQYLQEVIAYSDRKVKLRWQDFAWQEATATEYLDDGSRLQVTLHKEAESLQIDFSGTSPVHPGNLNATPAIVQSVVLYVMRLLLDEPLPLNEGLIQSVQVTLPECLLNPVFPASAAACPAVVGGNTEVSQRLTDTLLKALGLAACSQGTMNNLLFGNDRFGYYETIGGGTGAGPGFAGASGVHQHMTNTRMTDPEILEYRYPVRLWHFGLRQGSGGAGRFAGGEGICRELEFLAPVSVTLLTQHREQAPYGLHGGAPGAVGRQELIHPDGHIEPLSGIAQAELEPGTCLRILTPGGGGYGRSGA